MQAYSNPKRASDPHALPDYEQPRDPYAGCERRCAKENTTLPQLVSYCPDCGPHGKDRATVRCAVHGLADCGPFLYTGSRCLRHVVRSGDV
jgi:hypothetical protein